MPNESNGPLIFGGKEFLKPGLGPIHEIFETIDKVIAPVVNGTASTFAPGATQSLRDQLKRGFTSEAVIKVLKEQYSVSIPKGDTELEFLTGPLLMQIAKKMQDKILALHLDGKMQAESDALVKRFPLAPFKKIEMGATICLATAPDIDGNITVVNPSASKKVTLSIDLIADNKKGALKALELLGLNPSLCDALHAHLSKIERNPKHVGYRPK